MGGWLKPGVRNMGINLLSTELSLGRGIGDQLELEMGLGEEWLGSAG